MNNLPNGQIVPIGKAAEVLGVSIDTLRRWDKAGKITSVRPDGKDRYFNISDLEKIKANKPLSISEASKKLGISSSTLRRYEQKGILRPKRNEQGERVYDEDIIQNFSFTSAPKEEPKVKKEMKKAFFSGKAWQYPSAFVVGVLLITTIFSTLYIEEKYQANKEKISIGASKVLGAKDQGGIIGFFAGIGAKISENNKRVFDQYKLVFQTIQQTIIERTIVEKTTEIQKLVVDESLIKNLNAELLQGKGPGTHAGNIAYFVSEGVIAGLDISSANLLAGSVSGGSGGIILDSSITASDLATDTVTGSKIAHDTIKNENILDSAVTSGKIEDNTVSASDLTSTLTFDNGDLVDLSGITHSSTSKMGLILPNVSSASPSSPSSGEGYIAWDASGNQVVVYNGSSWSTVGGGTGTGDITSVTAGNGLTGGGIVNDVTLTVLLTASGTTGSTSSNSGLEVSASGLTLLKGCSDNEILKWTDSGGWACAADNGGVGGGIGTIEENDVSIVASATNIDFLGTDFVVGAVGTEGNISIDYPNSGITRDNQSETITSDWTFTLAEAEDFAINWSVSGTQAGQGQIITVTNSSASGNQYGLYLDNAASSGITESLLVIDNSDTDTVVTNAIQIVDAGGGFTNLFNVGGTLITSAEFTILDAGIALSELTDSGTLTAGTVDINGGAVDGTTVGANSTSTGAFTTLSATGNVTMNDSSADTILIGQSGTTDDTVTIAGNVSIADDNWAISDTGVGTSLTANALSCTSCIGATQITESEISSTGLSDTNDIGYLNQSETVVNDWTFTLAGAEDLAITHDLAGTANMMTLTGTPNASANTAYGIYIDQANSANANGLDAAIVIDNSDASGAPMGAAIKTIDGGAGFTNLFDIAGTLITSAEFTILDAGIALSELTDSGTLTAGTVDINGGAIDGVTIGGSSAGAGTFNAVTSTGAIAANSASGITSNQTTLIINAGGTVDVQDALTVDSLDTGGAESLAIGNTNANAVSICNSATCDTITIGTNNDADTITIGDTNDTNVSITDDNWSIGVTGIITTSGVVNANGGIAFDHATDTVGAHTLSGTLDANSNIITKIGATTTNFTTSGSLAIGLDAADTNGALMVDNVAQANPVIVAKDNGTIVWQVGDGGLITVDPAATGIIENIALAIQWTTGTIINAAFASATTQSAAEIGLAFDLSTNNTPPNSALGNQTGILLTLKDGGASAASTMLSMAGTYDTAILIGGTVGANILDSASIDITAAGAITGATGVSTTTVTATGAIAANSASGITSDQATLIINAGGIVDIQDALTVDSLDTGGAEGLALGNTNANAVSICNSNTCDTVSIGTNADADAINIGDANDTLEINAATINFTLAAGTTDFTINGLDSDSNLIFSGATMANCTALETISGVLTCGADAGEGSSPFTNSSGEILKASVGDFMTLRYGDAAEVQFTIQNTTTSTIPTADAMQIDLTGGTTGIVTNGVDGLQIAMEVGNGTANTNSGLNIAMTPINTPSGDETIYAINIANLTGSSASETAINIGTGWDEAIEANGIVTIGAQADSASTGSPTYTLINSAAGTFGSETNRDKVGSSVVYKGKLFVSTAETNLAGVYRYDGGTTWTLVTSSTLGKVIAADSAADADAFAMTVFDGKLWIGSQTAAATAAVYYSTTADTASAGDNFTMVNSARGTINAGTQAGIQDMTVYNGNLIVATQKTDSAEIARYEGGTVFTRINANVGKSAAETAADKDAFNLVVCANILYSGSISGTTTGVVASYQGNGTTWINTTVVATGGNFGAETVTSDINSLACWNGSLYIATSKTAGNAAAIYYYKATAAPVSAVAANYVRINTAVGKMLAADGAVIDSFVLKNYNGRLYAGSQTAAGEDVGALFEYTGIPLADFTLMSTGARGTFGSQTGVNAISTLQENNGTLYVGTDDGTNNIGAVYTWSKTSQNSYALRFDSGNSNYGAMSFVGDRQSADNNGHYGSFMLSSSVQLSSGSFDYAEDYPTLDSSLEPGEPVSIDPSHPEHVKRAKTGETVLGVVSQNPGLRLSSSVQPDTGGTWVPVALVGRVPVKVTTNGGIDPIKSGDNLTISDTPGVLQKAKSAGQIVGTALANYDSSDIGKVSMYVNPGWSAETISGLSFGLGSDQTFNIQDQNKTNVISFDSQGNATFAGTITADKIHANQIEGLTFLANQIISEKFTQALNVLDAQTASGSAVLGSADTNLEIDSLIANKGLTVYGLAKFMDGVTFSGAVSYLGDVFFERTPTFNKDTAGFAVIKEGSREVYVAFENEYVETPIVSASPIWDADTPTVDTIKQLGAYILPKQDYIVASISSKGFTIILGEPAVTDLKFSWFALAVSGARTINGATPEPTIVPTPIPTATPLPEVTTTPLPTPLLEIEPTASSSAVLE